MTYGCFNRQPMKTTQLVKDGYWIEPSPDLFARMVRHRIVEIPVHTSTECQYSKDNSNDPGCDGCQHRSQA